LICPASLQEALKAENPEAWSLWKSVMPYLDFASRAQAAKAQPVASLGAVVDNTQASYEPINLLARHNLAFEAVRPAGLTPARLQQLELSSSLLFPRHGRLSRSFRILRRKAESSFS
jgi:hypothetical protein